MKKQEDNPFEGLENLNNIQFEPAIVVMSDLEQKQSKGIRVQSVAYPPNYNPQRSEEGVVDWLRNTIQSVNSALYVNMLKYKST
jgi:hypothetical protein